jgi:hypothetical protein
METFDQLKALGLDTVSRLAGDSWTNFNESDPGITLLELLCYAITDLGYRAELPVEDLIAGRDGLVDLAARQLFPPEEILGSGPVTVDDYRRLLLDRFDDLINCWVRVEPEGPLTPPALCGVRGRLSVALSVASGTDSGLVAQVRMFLDGARNLCERFDDIAIAPEVTVTLAGSLIVSRSSDPVATIADLLERAQAALTPAIHFHARNEPRAGSEPEDDAFEGPLLRHGYLPAGELHPILDALSAQQLVENAVSSAPDVLALGPDFAVQVAAPPAATAWAWTYRVAGAALTLVDQRGVTLPSSMAAANQARAAATPLAPRTRVFPPPSPPRTQAPQASMNVAHYYSIQESLPRIYGLGQDRLDDSLPPKRRGEIRQLQGYLLHFEQLLANYLAQLAHVGELLSAAPQLRTYHYQPLYGVPGCAPLLDGADIDSRASSADMRDRWITFVDNEANSYVEALAGAAETEAEFEERRRGFLDHLLARFGEHFAIANRHTFETIENQEQFLAAYASLSARRTCGLQTVAPTGEPRREPGLASALKILLRPGGRVEETGLRRLLIAPAARDSADPAQWDLDARLLAFAADTRPLRFRPSPESADRMLVDRGSGSMVFESANAVATVQEQQAFSTAVSTVINRSIWANLYLLETVLWLPGETETPAAATTGGVLSVPARLFDLRMLLVMGNWTMWPDVTDAFKHYVQDLAESRAPAHLMLHSLWLSEADMAAFRERYQAWLDDDCRPLVLCTAPVALPDGEVAVLSDTPAAHLVAWLQQHWSGGAWPPGVPTPFGPGA